MGINDLLKEGFTIITPSIFTISITTITMIVTVMILIIMFLPSPFSFSFLILGIILSRDKTPGSEQWLPKQSTQLSVNDNQGTSINYPEEPVYGN